MLLKALCGKSLPDDATDLWEAFCHLRAARNAFAHEGLIYASKKIRTPLTGVEIGTLIDKCSQIFERIRDWIPEAIRWPKANATVELISTFPILGQISSEAEAEINMDFAEIAQQKPQG